MNFKPDNYKPPIFDQTGESWNERCASAIGRLVADFGNYYGNGQELYEELGEQVATLWIDRDEDPEPKYNWEDTIRDLCHRMWENDKARNPDLGSGVMCDTDVVVVSIYQKAGTSAVPMTLEQALTKQWDFDAYFVPVPGATTRLKKADVKMLSYLVFDMDTPNHEPLSEHMDWLEDQINKLESHTLLSEFAGFYTTNKGFRVIYKPERYLTTSKFFEMYQMYKHHMKLAGIDIDESCSDPSRLYRLPLVNRDGQMTDPLVNTYDPTVVVPFVGLPKILKNYEIVENENARPTRVPLSSKTIRSQILTLTGGWPKKVGGQLFYLDEQNLPQYLMDSGDLISWLQDNLDKVDITEGSGFVTRTDLFKSMNRHAESFSGLSKYPFYPRDPESYFLEDIPIGYEKGKLDELVDMFYPATPNDRTLIKSAFMSPLSNFGLHPVFTIDSTSGRGAGKTSLVKTIGDLYGGVIEVTPTDIKKGIQGNVATEFLQADGRQTRTVLIDNVTGFFKSSVFASIITSDKISGRLPYGATVVKRKNDLSWFLTSNDANYDKDYISRSVFIFLGEHKKIPNWEFKVKEFINKYRMDILREIEVLLQEGCGFESDKIITRFYDWEMNVLRKCCKDKEEYENLYSHIHTSKEQFDGDEEILSEIMSILYQNIKDEEKNYIVCKKDFYNACKLEMGYPTFTSIIAEGMKQNKTGKLTKRNKYGGRSSGKFGKACWIWGRDQNPEMLKIGGYF